MADWSKINTALGHRLEEETPAMRITTKDKFLKKVDDVVRIINEVLHKQVDEKSANPFKQRWWAEELTRLKKAQNRLSNKSHKFCHVWDHPAHAEYKAVANKFKDVMTETCNQDWIDWLEGASQQDLYLANKYISNEPSDYLNARIPALRIISNGMPDLAEDNEQKVKVLASSFFPLPLNTSHVPSHQEYPTPLKGPHFFSKVRIQQVICTLSPFKAPGPDKIPNVVLMKFTDVLIDHLFYIYRAIFKLTVYHPRWLESITLVLRKISKTTYDVAKSYRPIGLIDTIPKVLSTLCSKHISFLAEKHNLLPPTQFSGQPGRNTTDAMLLMVHKIKDAWRCGKVAAALFVDVQGAFPNTVKEQLIHNMRMRRVPKCFTDILVLSLTGRTTMLKFNDFMSDPIALDNGTTQGDPSSMNYYSSYNTPLIEIAASDDELSPRFVDDSMVLAIGNSLEQCHGMLKDMMEQPNGGFSWSLTHNSPFELSKTALINFPRSYRDPILGALSLDKPNAEGTITTTLVNAVSSYKYLSVIIDPKLRWTLQHKKAAAAASFWASQIGRLSKSASGLSMAGTKQLYNMVAVPRFTYGAGVWYFPIYEPQGTQKSRGSVSVNNKLRTAQRKVAMAIMGGLRTTAGDVLDAHAYILPIDLLMNKLLYRSALQLCSLPKSHLLHAQIRCSSELCSLLLWCLGSW